MKNITLVAIVFGVFLLILIFLTGNVLGQELSSDKGKTIDYSDKGALKQLAIDKLKNSFAVFEFSKKISVYEADEAIRGIVEQIFS